MLRTNGDCLFLRGLGGVNQLKKFNERVYEILGLYDRTFNSLSRFGGKTAEIEGSCGRVSSISQLRFRDRGYLVSKEGGNFMKEEVQADLPDIVFPEKGRDDTGRVENRFGIMSIPLPLPHFLPFDLPRGSENEVNKGRVLPLFWKKERSYDLKMYIYPTSNYVVIDENSPKTISFKVEVYLEGDDERSLNIRSSIFTSARIHFDDAYKTWLSCNAWKRGGDYYSSFFWSKSEVTFYIDSSKVPYGTHIVAIDFILWDTLSNWYIKDRNDNIIKEVFYLTVDCLLGEVSVPLSCFTDIHNVKSYRNNTATNNYSTKQLAYQAGVNELGDTLYPQGDEYRKYLDGEANYNATFTDTAYNRRYNQEKIKLAVGCHLRKRIQSRGYNAYYPLWEYKWNKGNVSYNISSVLPSGTVPVAFVFSVVYDVFCGVDWDGYINTLENPVVWKTTTETLSINSITGNFTLELETIRENVPERIGDHTTWGNYPNNGDNNDIINGWTIRKKIVSVTLRYRRST